MKVILTDNVKTLGKVGETVNVSAGYARNFLIPSNLAVLADESNAKQTEDHKKRLAKKVVEERAAAQATAKKLSGLTLGFVKKVGGSGRLFGTVTNAEISKVLEQEGIEIERRLIIINNPIKNLGTYEVSAKLFTDVEAKFKVKVEMDPAQAEEFKAKQAAAASKKAEKKSADVEETAEATEETAE